MKGAPSFRFLRYGSLRMEWMATKESNWDVDTHWGIYIIVLQFHANSCDSLPNICNASIV